MDRGFVARLSMACALAFLSGCNCPPADPRSFDIDRNVPLAELEAFVEERVGFDQIDDIECEDLCQADIWQARRGVETIDMCEFTSPQPGGPGRLECAGESVVVCEG